MNRTTIFALLVGVVVVVVVLYLMSRNRRDSLTASSGAASSGGALEGETEAVRVTGAVTDALSGLAVGVADAAS